MIKPIENFDGYFISDNGKVYCDLGKGCRDRSKRCELYEINPRPAKNDYLRVYMRSDIDNKRYDKYIHRLVAEAFLERIEGKNIVNHIDSNRQNNSISNLEWCNHRENNAHALEFGNQKRDSKTGRFL